MNISSYNITDTAYHLIGLRVLAGLPSTSSREEQTNAISRSVLKYANDKSLRLMLPAPRGNFESVGEKICQELAHFKLAESAYGKGLKLTDAGKEVLELLNERKNIELRRKMIELNLRTYDNLRQILQKHLELKYLFNPVVDARNINEGTDLAQFLIPTFGEEVRAIADSLAASLDTSAAKKIEDALREVILRHIFSGVKINVPLFRSITDRLVSLRLLNVMKSTDGDCEFAKSYSPCKASATHDGWYTELSFNLLSGEPYTLFIPEPDMTDKDTQEKLLISIDKTLPKLVDQAGYYDLPEVRDLVCEDMMIPEAAFDEGLNGLLDLQPSPVTVGLRYERITARRKPLVRTRESTQIFNLIRRV